MNIVTCPDCGDKHFCKGSAAEPSTTTSSTSPVTCRRCGEGNLAWEKSKLGKWYLCRTHLGADGKHYANRKEFHKCEGGAE